MRVYHYTSEQSLMQIITSKLFYPSYLNPQMDTAFGEGWYFTDLDPDNTPNDDLEQSLWLRAEPVKSKRFISFEIDKSLLQECRPHVYRLKRGVVDNDVIELNLTYTYTSTQALAIRFVTHGYKKIVYREYRNTNSPKDTLSVIALIGLVLWGISKS